MTKATFVIFFYPSYQVLLTDVVIIPRYIFGSFQRIVYKPTSDYNRLVL